MLYVKSEVAEVASDPIDWLYWYQAQNNLTVNQEKNIVNIAAVRRLLLPISANDRRTTLFGFSPQGLQQ